VHGPYPSGRTGPAWTVERRHSRRRQAEPWGGDGWATPRRSRGVRCPGYVRGSAGLRPWPRQSNRLPPRLRHGLGGLLSWRQPPRRLSFDAGPMRPRPCRAPRMLRASSIGSAPRERANPISARTRASDAGRRGAPRGRHGVRVRGTLRGPAHQGRDRPPWHPEPHGPVPSARGSRYWATCRTCLPL
jgi:hypothetical protein